MNAESLLAVEANNQCVHQKGTQIFGANQLGRDFVVGDIHGELELFRELLAAAEFDPEKDRVFSVGDLVDRGPDSPGCLRLTREPWFHAVRANHEDMLIRTWQGNPTSWMSNGGRWWLDVKEDDRRELAALAYLLPFAIVVHGRGGRFNVLHAEFYGMDSELDEGKFSKEEKQAMLWGREIIGGFGPETHPCLSITFVGHTPVAQPRRIGSHLFIDTGACFGGPLMMIEPETGNIFHVKKKEAE